MTSMGSAFTNPSAFKPKPSSLAKLLGLLAAAASIIICVSAASPAARPATYDELPEALALVAAAAAEKPRLIPLVVADSGYSENSSVNILCTVSQGHHDSLAFDWFKDGRALEEPASAAPAGQADKIDDANSYNDANGSPNNQRPLMPQIEKHSDHSLLRIARVRLQHAGRYTCTAKSHFGSDSSSVSLVVNVRLQWVREPPRELVVSVNQEVRLDCLAAGEPRPAIRWEKLAEPTSFGAGDSSGPKRHADGILMLAQSAPSQAATSGNNNNQLARSAPSATSHHRSSGANLISSNRYLNIARARESDSGVYECIASNSRDSDLRKLVHIQVRGK